MRRELNKIGWQRQALVHIQTTNALGRRPRPSSTNTQLFRPVRVMEASIWAGIQYTRGLSSDLDTQLRRTQT